MNIQPVTTRIFEEGEDLFDFISSHIKKLPEKSVLVIASKVVALAERRTIADTSKKNKERLVQEESDFAIKTRYTWLTLKDNVIMAAAGIDESNANKKLILLPKDSFASAQNIRVLLCHYYGIRNLGVIVSDSGLLPFRHGVIGMARGYAGFQGLKSYKGKKDIFGKKFVYSQIDIADSLTTAATVCMGEGNERQPLAVIADAPVVFVSKVNSEEMKIDPKGDIFYPLLRNTMLKVKISHAKKKK